MQTTSGVVTPCCSITLMQISLKISAVSSQDASDVASYQYRTVAKARGFVGRLPSEIHRVNVFNETTQGIMDGVTFPSEMLEKFFTTPNGKSTQRIFDEFNLKATDISRYQNPFEEDYYYRLVVKPFR